VAIIADMSDSVLPRDLHMRRNPVSRTSATLLGRLRHHPTDQAAWNEFVDRYGHKVYAWCRQWKLQDADACDLTQAVLVKLALKMQTFAYDPSLSFRAWLRTLAQHALRDFIADRRRSHLEVGGGEITLSLDSAQARDDLLARLGEEFDMELFDEASARVRLRVEPRTWEAFRLTAVERLPGSVAAERLQMKVTTVFQARSNVQKMLRHEISRLERARTKRGLSLDRSRSLS
jgi:RNA polymerase sigma factor (sigma-70 family)